MRVFLLMKIYAAIAIAILGVRVAFEFLSVIELVQFFGSVAVIAFTGTFLHLYFERKAHRTGTDAISSPSFLVSMVIITIIASTGIYMLFTYIYSDGFTLGFEIAFYAIFIPAIILLSIWMITRLQEEEYNKRLEAIKQEQTI